MAFRAGTTSYFALHNVGGTMTNLSPYIDSLTLPATTDTTEVSVFGTTAKAMITLQTGGEQISLSGPYDAPLATHLDNLKKAHAAGSAASAFIWGPGGSVASEYRVAGSVFVTQFDLSSSVGGRVEYSASLQITGAVTTSTF
jgi:hypothetical protein